MSNATIYLKPEDCANAKRICSALFMKEDVCRDDMVFLSRLGVILNTEGAFPESPISADDHHYFLATGNAQISDTPELKAVKGAYALINGTTDTVDCTLCDKSAEGTVKDGIAICETCHQDEVA